LLNRRACLTIHTGQCFTKAAILDRHAIRIELSGTWILRELWGSYQKEGIYFADLGMKKSFGKGKFDIRFSSELPDIRRGKVAQLRGGTERAVPPARLVPLMLC